MLRALRDVLVIAAFELQSSLRSRKALLLLGLYLAGAMAASGAFVSMLRAVEDATAEALSVATTEDPGAMTRSLMENEQLLDVATELVGDRELARQLLSIPPLALFYGWLALTFVPVLVTLTSSDAIAADVDSGAARYALVRTRRSAWAAGKLLGQVLLMGCGIALGAVGSWSVGLFFTSGFEPLATGAWMLRLGGRACLSGFAYLGLVLGVSQLTRSANRARAFGLLALIAVGGLRALLGAPRVHDEAPVLFDSLAQVLPGTHAMGLWQPQLLQRLPSVGMLLALGAAFFVLGHQRFARRDG